MVLVHEHESQVMKSIRTFFRSFKRIFFYIRQS